MSGQNNDGTEDGESKFALDEASTKEGDLNQPRRRSTIAFPYSDLSDAVHIAQAIHDHAGHGECDDAQLSAWVGQSPKSSGFRTHLSATRMFGLMESDGGGKHKLTLLGRQIVDPSKTREAKVRAFLTVPLYQAAYEKYKEGVVPPPAALERDFVSLGVSEKQKDRARNAFTKSAEQAGFFEHGKSRLVQPGLMPQDIKIEPVQDVINTSQHGDNGSTGEGATLALDPLLMALLHKIPPKDDGWSVAKRVRWFRTFAMNVSQVYDDDENPVELKIDVIIDPGQ